MISLFAMNGHQFGRILNLVSFGESHGPAIGGVLTGMPSGIVVNEELIRSEMMARRPGQSEVTSPRKEDDSPEFLSGIFEGKTTGTPIAFIIRNKDHRSKDYDALKDVYRPSHADYVYEKKYGFRDHLGGGRSSARETAVRVVAGCFAQMLLNKVGIEVYAFVSSVKDVSIKGHFSNLNLDDVYSSEMRCPDAKIATHMKDLVLKALEDGDSLGGIITAVVKNSPIGLGAPVYGKLHADLGAAMLGINAVKGFEIGSGFQATTMTGSEHNDEMKEENGKIKSVTNHSGGVQGGISNGEDIYFKVAFKPVATIRKAQQSVDKKGNQVIVEGKGRHDPCVVPRAVPIVKAMTSLVLADHYLLNKTVKFTE